jgi:hypothetical protein
VVDFVREFLAAMAVFSSSDAGRAWCSPPGIVEIHGPNSQQDWKEVFKTIQEDSRRSTLPVLLLHGI